MVFKTQSIMFQLNSKSCCVTGCESQVLLIIPPELNSCHQLPLRLFFAFLGIIFSHCHKNKIPKRRKKKKQRIREEGGGEEREKAHVRDSNESELN